MIRTFVAALSMALLQVAGAEPMTIAPPDLSGGPKDPPESTALAPRDVSRDAQTSPSESEMPAAPDTSDGAQAAPSDSTTLMPPDVSDGAQAPPSDSTTWSYVAQGAGALWASARSDEGTLGQFCNGEVGFCIWVLLLRGVECLEGEEHPVLLNTDRVAGFHTIKCIGTMGERGATFAFTDFAAIDEAVRAARQLAIAIPEQGDTIVVTHFSLAGAVAALDKLREAVNDQSSADGDHSGRSEKSRHSAGSRNPSTPA